MSYQVIAMPMYCYMRLSDFVCKMVTPIKSLLHVDDMLEVADSWDDTLTEDIYHEGFNDTGMTDEEWGDFFTNEDKATDIIHTYVPPFLLFFGTLGNLASVLVLHRMSKKVFSTCLYLMILAIVDLLVLYIRCGNMWLVSINGMDLTTLLMNYSQSMCKVLPFAFNFFLHLYVWLIVCSSIEVYIATSYPQKVPKMCTLERSRAVILLLTVLLVCVNVHFFWSLELVSLKEQQHTYTQGFFCTFAKHGQILNEEFTLSIWPALDIIIADILPYTVVMLSTILCVWKIIRNGRSKRLREEAHQIWKAKFTLDPDGIEQMKRVFITLYLFYMLLTLPKSAILMFDFLNHLHKFVNEYDPLITAKIALAKCVCSMLFYIFLSCKVFLYFAMSKRFRQEAFNIILCKQFLRKKPSYPPVNYSRRPLLRTQAKSQIHNQVPQAERPGLNNGSVVMIHLCKNTFNHITPEEA